MIEVTCYNIPVDLPEDVLAAYLSDFVAQSAWAVECTDCFSAKG